MSLLRRRATPAAPAVPEFAFCEPVHAVTLGPIHIRRVGEEGLKLGGGIPVAPLCGRESVIRGWDLPDEVTPETVLADSTPRPGDGHVFLCRACTDAYNALTDQPGDQPGDQSSDQPSRR